MTEILFIIVLVMIALLFQVQMLALIFVVRKQGGYFSGIDQFSIQTDHAGHKSHRYFRSATCYQCRQVLPVVIELITAGEPQLALDIAYEPEQARAVGIFSSPECTLVESGVVIRNMLGQKTKKAVLGISHEG